MHPCLNAEKNQNMVAKGNQPMEARRRNLLITAVRPVAAKRKLKVIESKSFLWYFFFFLVLLFYFFSFTFYFFNLFNLVFLSYFIFYFNKAIVYIYIQYISCNIQYNIQYRI
jgi:hypothetical protein